MPTPEAASPKVRSSLALALACLLATVPLYGSLTANLTAMRSAFSLSLGLFVFTLISIVCLALGFVQCEVVRGVGGNRRLLARTGFSLLQPGRVPTAGRLLLGSNLCLDMPQLLLRRSNLLGHALIRHLDHGLVVLLIAVERVGFE